MGTHHTFYNCVSETFNHGFSPSEVDWGNAIDVPIKHGPNYTSNGCMLMEVDWGDKLKLNYASYGCILIEIDWGGKFNCTSCGCHMASGCPMANWQGHETHPTGHNTSEVDWGGHDPNPNHMNVSLLSEVDLGAHDSSVFLFLVNIDYDAKPNESSIQGLWGELQHRTSSIPLIRLKTDSLATGKTGDDIFNSTSINPDLDNPEQLTGESIQSFLTVVVQLQWLVAQGRLVTHAQVTTFSKLKLTQKKLQRTYGYTLQINEFYWTQPKYYLHEILIKDRNPFKFLKMATKLLMIYGGIIISRPTFRDIFISSK